MKEKFLNKGNISLFAVTFLVTVLTAVICNLCGADRLTTVCCAPVGGIISVLGIGALCEIEDVSLPVSPDAGVLGTTLGLILTMIIY